MVLVSCQDNAVQDELLVIASTGNADFKDGANSELSRSIRSSTYKYNSILFADIFNHAIRKVNHNGGEIVLPLWLLIKGVNVEVWEKRAIESV